MTENHYDYFVIGAGSGGIRSARIAAAHGAKVGMAEYSKLGGTCVNLGCVPKKIMSYGALYKTHFEDSRGYGWIFPAAPEFDWNTLIRNKDIRIEGINTFFDGMLANLDIDVHRGRATFIDSHTLDINGMQVTADHILIAVGGTPRRMDDIPGGEHMVTSEDVFHWPRAPKKAVIYGGGYIAVEFAHILHGTGCEVTLIYRKDLFLRSFDRDISETLAQNMHKQGIKLLFDTKIERVEKSGENYIIHDSKGAQHECDLPFAAIGRIPNLAGLNLDKAGVGLDKKGYIKVDEYNNTNASGLYAVGDVTDTYHLTPVAIREGHILADRLFNKEQDKKVDYGHVATVIFSNPPIGTIGISEEEARTKRIDIKIFKNKMVPMKNRIAGRDEETMMKLIVDRKSDKVIGCHMIGSDAAEIMQGFTVAMNMGATKADFDRTIAIHPTASEEFVTMREESA